MGFNVNSEYEISAVLISDITWLTILTRSLAYCSYKDGRVKS
jgi:hypothetical protein